jgi:hypothetical protein
MILWITSRGDDALSKETQYRRRDRG